MDFIIYRRKPTGKVSDRTAVTFARTFGAFYPHAYMRVCRNSQLLFS